MPPSSPALRVLSITAAAAVLALAVGLFPTRPAAADSPDPSPAPTSGAEALAEDCGLLCLPIFDGGPQPTGAERQGQATQPADVPAQPKGPAGETSAQPEQPAAGGAGTTPPSNPTPEATGDVPGESGIAADHAVAISTSSNAAPADIQTRTAAWDTPATRSTRATQVAALTPAAGSGPDGPELLPVAAGVLLVAAGGGAFLWWGRNRLRTH